MRRDEGELQHHPHSLGEKLTTHQIAAAEPPSLVGRLIKTLSFWNHHKDSENLTIPITGEDVAVEALVHFFYHGDYLPDGYDVDMDKFDKDMEFHTAVQQVARAYGVKQLGVLARYHLAKARDGGVGGESGLQRVEHVDVQGPSQVSTQGRGVRMV